MTAIIIALTLGIVVGAFNLLPKIFYRVIDKLMSVILFVLIFVLIVSIASNETIVGNLAAIGISAFVLAFGSIIGRIILLYLLQQKWFKEER